MSQSSSTSTSGLDLSGSDTYVIPSMTPTGSVVLSNSPNFMWIVLGAVALVLAVVVALNLRK